MGQNNTKRCRECNFVCLSQIWLDYHLQSDNHRAIIAAPKEERAGILSGQTTGQGGDCMICMVGGIFLAYIVFLLSLKKISLQVACVDLWAYLDHRDSYGHYLVKEEGWKFKDTLQTRTCEWCEMVFHTGAEYHHHLGTAYHNTNIPPKPAGGA